MLLLGALLALQLTTYRAERGEVNALVERARTARYQQDSTLASYQVMVRQRMSGGIGMARGPRIVPVGRERLAVRFESVARVGWHHQLGAWAEVIGARGVAPMFGDVEPHTGTNDEDVALVLPYAPGRDRLWPVDELRDAMPNADDWIEHPLAPGADSLYAYSVGDSLAFRLPNGDVVMLRELRVRPRRPDARLIVGSLWVDDASGSLVRAAYRPSIAMDLWPFMEREIGRHDRDKVRKLGPFTGIIREIVVEHGLYERRFWLPRARIASAEGSAKGGRVTISIEQTFQYERVAALAPGVAAGPTLPMEIEVDSRTGRVRRPKWHGIEERTGRCRERGDASDRWSPDSLLHDEELTVMHAEGVRFRVLLPCDPWELINSPALPPSIYSAGDELFAETDFNALRKDVEGALAMSSQAKWAPQRVTLHYGIEDGLLRYNRVEGLSAALSARRILGDGYTAHAAARIGVADLAPNVELSLLRSNMRSDVIAGAYRRLAVANDWGNALRLGASINAILFGRDDGFYYRTMGAELGGAHRGSSDGRVLSWRLFGERHDSAAVGTHVSVANLVGGARFAPNIGAREGMYWGGAAAMQATWGVDPRGTRLSSGTRAEAASSERSETAYGRLMTELTIARGLGGRLQGTLTAAAGAAAGSLPAQRLWYVGGAHTVRGYPAGELAGDAFWIGRAELAMGHPIVRPALFADGGWAGSRHDWNSQSRLLSGAGVGATMLDGLVRLDLSRGLEGASRWRMDFYIDVR